MTDLENVVFNPGKFFVAINRESENPFELFLTHSIDHGKKGMEADIEFIDAFTHETDAYSYMSYCISKMSKDEREDIN